MHTCKFKEGDRVVYMPWGGPQSNVAGTVITVCEEKSSFPTAGPIFLLEVILDTAELIEDEASCWISEQDYITQAYIPF